MKTENYFSADVSSRERDGGGESREQRLTEEKRYLGVRFNFKINFHPCQMAERNDVRLKGSAYQTLMGLRGIMCHNVLVKFRNWAYNINYHKQNVLNSNSKYYSPSIVIENAIQLKRIILKN